MASLTDLGESRKSQVREVEESPLAEVRPMRQETVCERCGHADGTVRERPGWLLGKGLVYRRLCDNCVVPDRARSADPEIEPWIREEIARRRPGFQIDSLGNRPIAAALILAIVRENGELQARRIALETQAQHTLQLFGLGSDQHAMRWANGILYSRVGDLRFRVESDEDGRVQLRLEVPGTVGRESWSSAIKDGDDLVAKILAGADAAEVHGG